MGEVSVMAVLVDHIRRQNEKTRFYVTVMTETGFNRARDLLGGDIPVSFFPFDYRSPIKRFLKRVRPDAAVFIETEIWPNWIKKLHRSDIPIVLANGRLSEKSARRYARFGESMRKLMSCYNRIIVQSGENRARFMSIGADESRITIAGSLKFDAPVRDLADDDRRSLRHRLPFDTNARIWICGSSRNGEHGQLLDVYSNLARKHPLLKMILVPRHLEKIDDIIGMINDRNLKFLRYTEMEKNAVDADILLVDQIGCLNDLYPVSDIAFVGGTLVEIGGHNLLEPVWAGVPVLFGPHLDNVKDSAEYITKEGFGQKVEDKHHLETTLDSFLSGRLEFARKTDVADGSSGASGTARIIISLLQK
jgi:3-deoxy-D-manno-octulosonic-acid transferase